MLRKLLTTCGAVLLAVGVSCGDELDQPSLIETLRVIAVTADTTYPRPDEPVTVRLTYADGLGAAPRPVEVTWIAGCVDPPSGSYDGCFSEVLAAWQATGGEGDYRGYRFERQLVDPEWNGVPDAVPFTTSVPFGKLAPEAAAATAYVFFMVCAGRLQAATPEALRDGAAFPLVCVDAEGQELGADSFVPGFAELFVYRDGRTNDNPPVEGLLVGSVPTDSNPDAAPVVASCPEREDEGCNPGFGPGQNAQQQAPCATYPIRALVPDVAEVVPGELDADGAPLRETVWVNYYVDAGELDRNDALVSDAAEGYRDSFDVSWTPPAEPGLVTLWAVGHDSRGGASIRRGVVRVQ